MADAAEVINSVMCTILRHDLPQPIFDSGVLLGLTRWRGPRHALLDANFVEFLFFSQFGDEEVDI